MQASVSFGSITVDFGATRALDGVTFDIAPGEIVGLLGHNGAGKSTLLNVATGAIRASAGELRIDGRPIPADASPAELAGLGVTVIHQEPALAGNLSVLDNLFVGRKGESRVGRRSRALDALARVGGEHIELDVPVAALGLGDRQVVDLARGALAGDIKVLFLDEPTAALGLHETRALHALITELAAAGTAVVYVSHRLPDVVEVCSRVVILREGRVVEDLPIDGVTPRTLTTALAPDIAEDHGFECVPGDVAVQVHGADAPDMVFHEGEVVGVFGVAGGPQFQLLQALSGAEGAVDASLRGATFAPRSPAAAIAAGVHSVPADRDTDGLILGLSALDNVFLPWRSRLGARVGFKARASRTRRLYQDWRPGLHVQGPDGDAAISSFSGGNRQKHLLMSWLQPVRPGVLLLAQPTQGVDVGARADIRHAVREAAAAGTAVIVASAESDEIASLCDRAYVLAHGRVTEIARVEGADFGELLLDTLLDTASQKELVS